MLWPAGSPIGGLAGDGGGGLRHCSLAAEVALHPQMTPAPRQHPVLQVLQSKPAETYCTSLVALGSPGWTAAGADQPSPQVERARFDSLSILKVPNHGEDVRSPSLSLVLVLREALGRPDHPARGPIRRKRTHGKWSTAKCATSLSGRPGCSRSRDTSAPSPPTLDSNSA